MSSFDDIAVAYDSTIDWDSRLEREMPFILQTYSDWHGKRVLDLACGSGRHSIGLAKQGAEVIGIDNSASMVYLARRLAESEDVPVEFREMDMQDINRLSNEFDLVLCLGNSLALAGGLEEFQSVISHVNEMLSRGGRFIFQVLNFEDIIHSGHRYMPLKGGTTDKGEEVVFGRFFDYSHPSECATLVLSTYTKMGKEWTVSLTEQQVLKLDWDLVESALANAGFVDTAYFSDYNQTKFQKEKDRNIIVRTCRR